MNCPKCGHANALGVSFCGACGSQLAAAPPGAGGYGQPMPGQPMQGQPMQGQPMPSHPPPGYPPPGHAPPGPPFGQAHAPYGAPQSPYAPPGAGYDAYQPERTSGLAIAGLILSFLCSLVGLILSIMALNEINKNEHVKGKGLAIAGIVISIVFMLLGIIINVASM